ncbi:hypothetical protein [Archaeoglobus veneficus]|uniref:Uncharacterized protein n=1 Tax=Archaeoglobus veneficus (strain DSM 11195 / SNP6) TaxID=693661 RepID=F2KMZ5_ARCVS|nr:hypothetical protein [Archaeoglobus veneficus]AEA47271.1 hypothetical protein Arcve_1264 [Archaeoglobus veneficus SNP6]
MNSLLIKRDCGMEKCMLAARLANMLGDVVWASSSFTPYVLEAMGVHPRAVVGKRRGEASNVLNLNELISKELEKVLMSAFSGGDECPPSFLPPTRDTNL